MKLIKPEVLVKLSPERVKIARLFKKHIDKALKS